MTDALKPGSLRSAADLFGKLVRDIEVLQDEVNSDRLFNFVVTGYSLIDWIKNDPSVAATAKTKEELDGLYGDKWLAVCGDLATAAKHFTLTTRKPTASGVTAERGFGRGRYGKGAFGVGEEQITIHLLDGASHGFLELVHGVIQAWVRFFSRHGIPLDTSWPGALGADALDATDG